MNTEQQTLSEEPKLLDLEVAPIEAITRAEVDVQIATAHQYPRSLAQFYKRAEAMVTVDQETAESCIYRLRRKDKDAPGGYKIIEGESIRMAEIVAANFGNLRSAVHVVGHTPTRVTVRAVCHDLETNNLIAVEKQTKTTYSNGSPYNEDMAILATNALVSKALRDAIFRVVPKALIKPLKEKAKLVAFGSGQAFVERRKRAVEWATKTRGVPLDRVLATLGVKGIEDITIDHLELLTGLKTAIMEGDQTVDEAFPPLASETKPLMEHPEQKKQREAEAAKEQERVKAEVQAALDKEKLRKASEVIEKTQEKETVTTPSSEASRAEDERKMQEEDKKIESLMGLAPEEPRKEEPKPEPAPAPATPEPSQPPELKPGQAALKKGVEAAGYTFADFINTFAGKAAGIPKKTDPTCPKDWYQFDESKAAFCVKSIKGVIAAMKAAKGKG